MLRAIPLILLLAWAGQAVATGFDEDHCPQRELSRTQWQRMDAKVHAGTGLHLDDSKLYACFQTETVTVYGSTRRVTDPDGSERWYEAHCKFDRKFLRNKDCVYIGQRVIPIKDHWPEGEGKIFVSMDADGVLMRRRLGEALILANTLDERHVCDSGESTAQQILELRSDLSAPWYQLHAAMEGERFTLWTLRYAIHFTAATPDAALLVRCWRPKKSPDECLTTECPA